MDNKQEIGFKNMEVDGAEGVFVPLEVFAAIQNSCTLIGVLFELGIEDEEIYDEAIGIIESFNDNTLQ